MPSEFKTSCDEAVDAVKFQGRLRNNVGDFIRLPDRNAEGHTLVDIRIAELSEFIRKTLSSTLYGINAIIDTIAYDLSNVIKTIAKIVNEVSSLLIALYSQRFSKFNVIGSCDLRP